MKVILLFAGLCALALAVPPPAKTVPKKYKIEDKVFLEKQLNIIRLFRQIHQHSFYPEFIDIAEKYHPESHLDLYTHPEYVKEFLHYYHHDILPIHEIFSVFYYEHLQQAISLFKMFYYAKDYDTFYKTAVWARQHINEGMFLYAFSVAVVHRPDTYGMVLPPIYEVYPQYFFNSEVIYKAQKYKQMFHDEYPKAESDWHGYTIHSNYSGWYMNLDPQQALSYFTEDIGLNAFYYYYHIFYPFWMDGQEFNLKHDRRGELFYAIHKELLARYYCERLSHGFEPIHTLPRRTEIETAYYPSLEYPNGLDFPSRPPHVPLNWDTSYGNPHYNFSGSYFTAHDYIRRMRDALGLGFVYTHAGQKVSLYQEHGIEIFANMLEGNPNSPNIDFYGIMQIYVRHVLGYAPTPLHKYHTVPAVVEHYETALRDPVYWQFVKWMVDFFQEYKHHEKKYYTKHDLEFEGVEVQDIKVDRLVTYFDYFYSDLSHAVYYNEKHETEPFHVRVRQERLNHKPFTYTINVKSEKPVESIVRVYIGPKYDIYRRNIDINENRLHFYLIDKFHYHLESGMNAILRNSKQSLSISDKTTYWQLYKRIMGAIKSSEEFVIDGSETYWGIPNRLILPIGRYGGMPFQFYVIVTPYTPEHTQKVPDERYYPKVGTGGWWLDELPFGFPFDKPIDPSVFYVPNSHFEEVIIYHKEYKDLNVSTQE